MITRIVAATLLLGGLTHGAMAADSAKTSAPTPPTTDSSTQAKQSIPQELRQKLTSAGYTDVEIIPSSFLVSAKSKDGNRVMMRISPNSMTMLTEVPVASTTGSAASDKAESSKAK